MLANLLEDSHLITLEQVPELVGKRAATVGFSELLILLADLREEVLVALDPGGVRSFRVDASLAGRAFRDFTMVTTAREVDHHFWIPLLDGTERLGVLGVAAPDDSKSTVDTLRALASLLALILVSKRPHSDTYQRLVRTRPMTVASEVVWPLMPPLTFATDNLVLAAVLEPAYEIGGDAVDYAIEGDVVHLSIFDAMGHDQAAGLTVALATGTCRAHRRRGLGLVDTSVAVDEVIGEQFGGLRFATGVLARLDFRTGRLNWVNRGHPPPLLIRQGRWLRQLQCRPAPPMGFRLPSKPVLCHEHLEPGDRLLFYTDGIIEARDVRGRQFGLRRFADFVIRREADGHAAPETLRRLMRSVLDHQSGRLQDDASALLVEWQHDREKSLLVSTPNRA
ncbi:stage II sporulation protein E [Lentzea atacamensis]|uniref:Stage II sporulation protein E n=2 Tax=Lentzea TaxID=165301 RepID=A0A316IIL0_9PSEU|nr:PP2C family protein-serine/threonine phosphatase [Lentzea atacamensis]PWK87029.1 stage II sporulation protein E [Lentzea atacamensis]RAS70262.1 stage II sporulation protein E [Lentzea atacamensis]